MGWPECVILCVAFICAAWMAVSDRTEITFRKPEKKRGESDE